MGYKILAIVIDSNHLQTAQASPRTEALKKILCLNSKVANVFGKQDVQSTFHDLDIFEGIKASASCLISSQIT